MKNKALDSIKNISYALAAIGIIISVLRLFLNEFIDPKHQNFFQALSLALFFGGFLLFIWTLDKRFDEFSKIYNHTINDRTTIATLLDGYVCSTYSASQGATHLLVTVKFLRESLDNLTNLISNLEKLQSKKPGCFAIPDRSIVLTLLNQCQEHLPDGGLWIGITKLSSREAWEKNRAQDEFFRYASNIQRRARDQEIIVVRLYVFTDNNQFSNMHDLIQEEKQGNRIIVKILTLNSDFTDEPPDISLLWSARNKQVVNKIRNEENSRLLQNLTEDTVLKVFLGGKDWVPSCGLDFVTKRGEILEQVTIMNPESDEFDNKCRKFCQFWSKAVEFE